MHRRVGPDTTLSSTTRALSTGSPRITIWVTLLYPRCQQVRCSYSLHPWYLPNIVGEYSHFGDQVWQGNIQMIAPTSLLRWGRTLTWMRLLYTPLKREICGSWCLTECDLVKDFVKTRIMNVSYTAQSFTSWEGHRSLLYWLQLHLCTWSWPTL